MPNQAISLNKTEQQLFSDAVDSIFNSSIDSEQKLANLTGFQKLVEKIDKPEIWGRYAVELEKVVVDQDTERDLKVEALHLLSHFSCFVLSSYEKYPEAESEIYKQGYKKFEERSREDLQPLLGEIRELLRSTEVEHGGFSFDYDKAASIRRLLSSINEESSTEILKYMRDRVENADFQFDVAQELVIRGDLKSAEYLIELFEIKIENKDYGPPRLPTTLIGQIPINRALNTAETRLFVECLNLDPYSLPPSVAEINMQRNIERENKRLGLETKSEEHFGDREFWAEDLSNVRHALALHLAKYPESQNLIKKEIGDLATVNEDYRQYQKLIQSAEKGGIKRVFSFQKTVLSKLVKGLDISPSEIADNHTVIVMGEFDPVGIHVHANDVVRDLMRHGHSVGFVNTNSDIKLAPQLREQTVAKLRPANNIIYAYIHGDSDGMLLGEPNLEDQGVDNVTLVRGSNTYDVEDINIPHDKPYRGVLAYGGKVIALSCSLGKVKQNGEANMLQKLALAFPLASDVLGPVDDIGTAKLRFAEDNSIDMVLYNEPRVNRLPRTPGEAMSNLMEGIGDILMGLREEYVPVLDAADNTVTLPDTRGRERDVVLPVARYLNH